MACFLPLNKFKIWGKTECTNSYFQSKQINDHLECGWIVKLSKKKKFVSWFGVKNHQYSRNWDKKKKSQFPSLITTSLPMWLPFPFPLIVYPIPCLPPSLPPHAGSGMGELPVVWCLRFVVGTSIPQRTQRSCSTTRRLWWTETRSSSAWRRPGASCPFSSSPSSTISTGE